MCGWFGAAENARDNLGRSSPFKDSLLPPPTSSSPFSFSFPFLLENMLPKPPFPPLGPTLEFVTVADRCLGDRLETFTLLFVTSVILRPADSPPPPVITTEVVLALPLFKASSIDMFEFGAASKSADIADDEVSVVDGSPKLDIDPDTDEVVGVLPG
jgi:hypothetical protein